MPPALQTDRLRLGAWTDKDLDPFYAMVAERDPRTAAAPRNGRPTRDDLAAKVAQRKSELAVTGMTLYAIRADGEFLGYCGLTPGRFTPAEPEVAYELLRAHHGRGYATEALRAVVAAVPATGRERLWASVRAWNTASFGVLAKVGFAFSGEAVADEFGESELWTLDVRAAPLVEN